MAPITRAGARRALIVDESTADEPSDACSRTNQDDGRARRKRRRSTDVFSFAYEQDAKLRKGMAMFSAMFAYVFCMVMFMFAYEKEEEEVSTGKDEDKDKHVSTDNEEEDDVCTDIQEEEEEDTYLDADLLECSLDCLKSMKAGIDRVLGPDNVIYDEIIDIFEQDLDLDQDELLSSAHDMFASKDRKFRSLMVLPVDMRKEWLLIHTRKL